MFQRLTLPVLLVVVGAAVGACGAGGAIGGGGVGSGGQEASGTGGTAPGTGGPLPEPRGGEGGRPGGDAAAPDVSDPRLGEPDAAGAVDSRDSRGGTGTGGGVVVAGDPAHQSGGPFVGPTIPADCPGDPAQGWTEYIDTFQIQRPYDLMESQRFTFENGTFTFWVLPTDKAFERGNSTEPRTEARWSNFTSNRPHLWSSDLMFERPTNHSTIFQIHTTASGAGPVYLREDDGNVHPLNGAVFVSDLYDKWFNLKVAFDPATLEATIWINNCQKVKGVIGPRGNGVNYFKNGVYTCTSALCRDHYKNIHLYTK